jgi:nucleotide-binding universal stress UspA family protein
LPTTPIQGANLAGALSPRPIKPVEAELRILIPVDGSDASLRVIRQLLDQRKRRAHPEPFDVHLLNVQHGLSSHLGRLLTRDDIDDYHRDEGMKCLATARATLDAVGVPYTHHIGVGDPGEVIVGYAEELDCEQIQMGIHNRGAVETFFMGSVTTEVLKRTKVPVLLVP